MKLTRDELSKALVQDQGLVVELRRQLWYRGELGHILRPHGQAGVYDWVWGEHRGRPVPEPFVVETHRRFGKSFLGLVFAVEVCLRGPGRRVVYAAPTREQLGPIVHPNMARILETCPVDLRPRRTKGRYEFRNPRWPKGSIESVVEIFGVNSNPDAARGAACNVGVIDEAGYVEDLPYFMRDVLGWQFMGQEDPLCLMFSTPPPSMSHPFISEFIPNAKRGGRYCVVRASENEDFTRDDYELVSSVVGEPGSVAWRREAECEHLADPEQAVVPEWGGVRSGSLVEVERPAWFIPFVFGDLGFVDYTHILFGYVNFEDQLLVVERELRLRHSTDDEIIGKVKELEEELWPWEVRPHEVRRVLDASPQQLWAFRKNGMDVSSARRHDAFATLASMRGRIRRRGLRVHPSCEQLDYQLLNGVWNSKRTDFSRSEALGHLDGVKALAYGMRQAPWDENPFPEEPFDWANRHKRLVRNGPRGSSSFARAFQ